MALSRLQNFLSNPSGVVLYVDPGNFDATDSIENRGTSPGRPFYSLQRALIESARFSFQLGRNNDLNDRTTISVSPGKHYIDNRPGFSIQNINEAAVIKRRISKNGWAVDNITPLNENSNFDIFDPNNDLYKYNSIYGGVILPRGTSIVGQDLRKTKIIPLYVPDPLDEEIEHTSIFNVTGACYFNAFTFFDADLTKFSYKNYTNTKHIPRYSHHKLVTFAYADGVNPVIIGATSTGVTDLDMYYRKLTIAYNNLSGRGLEDFPVNLDFEPNVNEFRIVGPAQDEPLGISSIRAGNGDGSGDKSIITVTTANLQSKIETPHNLTVDTQITISGVTESPNSYNGTFTVREVVGLTTFTYTTTTIPSNVSPNPVSYEVASVSTEVDAVSSASPYILNCSLRSLYGMCGMLADGNKSTGFKSMVVAQYTGISLQKDENSYLIYDKGVLYDNFTLPTNSPLRPLHKNSKSIYKPDYENFHIKASNDAFIQAVSVFSIGYSKQFVVESGADMSITNSNSNFGANALNSVGFKKIAFARNDVGYITHIIPPKEIDSTESSITWLSFDIDKIKTIENPRKLYISGHTSRTTPPPHKLDGFRIGARLNDRVYMNEYSSPICMDTPSGVNTFISRKEYKISRVGNVNSISTNGTITLTENHHLFTGEKIRLFSNTGQAPDKLQIDKVYYAITSSIDGSLASNQIKLAVSLNDAISGVELTGLVNNGGVITILSTVTDKLPGEFGHPIQWDTGLNNWYLISSSTSDNEIYSNLLSLDFSVSPTTYFKRIQDNRSAEERIYKLRYVIPKEYLNAKEPQVGYILQESSNVTLSTISSNLSLELTNSTELRNDRVITSAVVGSVVNNSQIVTITTELPHNLIPGDIVSIKNVRSTNNQNALGIVSTYNGEFDVVSVPSSRRFTYVLTENKINPGTFTNNINQRDTRQQREILPVFSKQAYKNNFYIYKIDPIKRLVPGENGQDGIYHLTVLSSSVGINTNSGFKLSEKHFNQDVRNLYPQIDRDNIVSNPTASVSYADLNVIGNVITDDKKKSITLEAVDKFSRNTGIGFQITNVSVSGIGSTTITLTTNVDHKLNSIKNVSFNNSGSGYPLNSKQYSKNLIDSNLSEDDSTCNYQTTLSGNVDQNSFRLVDSGSAHTIGETLTVDGGVVPAIVQVVEINNNVGDSLQLSGFVDTPKLNGVFEIISIPSKKSIVISVPTGIPQYTPNTIIEPPIGYIASKGVNIVNMNLANVQIGIATITTSYPHGLSVGNKFKLVNTNLSYYNNKDFIVNDINSVNSFTFNVGEAPNANVITLGKILKYGISSNKFQITRGNDDINSTSSILYSGLSIVLTSEVELDDLEINVDSSNGIYRGDFIEVGGEILRVASDPNANTFKVLRGQLGTNRANIPVGSVGKKIKTIPVEIRRPSSIRCSGHTFEYVGFGPGNYSTALPQKQDRILSDDEVRVSQAKKQEAGNIMYSGMNDSGDFYTGSKKISSITGEETLIESPILTYTGDDLDELLSAKQSGVFDELLIKSKIIVEGGVSRNDNSQFYGPVSIDNRLTNLSDQGIVVKNIFMRGSGLFQDKLVTVGISTPTENKQSGDISLILNPVNVNYIGHIFRNQQWMPFGPISIEKDILNLSVDKLGVGATSGNFNLNVLGNARIQNLEITGSLSIPGSINLQNVTYGNITVNGTATFTGTGVTYTQIHQNGTSLFNRIETLGISTFFRNVDIKKSSTVGAVTPNLFVEGSISVGNSITATEFIGDGSKLTNLPIGGGSVSFATTAANVIGGIGSITSLRVSGITTLNQVQVQGSITATQFIGDGSQLTNLPIGSGGGGSISFATTAANVIGGVGNIGSLRVTGITTLTNLLVTGISTFNNTIDGTITNSINAQNAASATNLNRTVSAGNGLTGGGTLNSNITLNVNPGIGITIVDDKVSVDGSVVRTVAANTNLVVLHVSRNSATALTGSASVPAGYDSDLSTVGYIPDGPGLQGLLFSSVTEALVEARNILVPVGAEIIISVHNQLNSSFPEQGPIILANSTAKYVIAGARGAITTPTIYFNRTTTTNAISRLPGSTSYFFSVGAIFQDITIDINMDGVDDPQGSTNQNTLSFGGGFAINARDLVIDWKNLGRNSKIGNITASYGEQALFRLYSPLVTTGSNKRFITNLLFQNTSVRTNDKPQFDLITQLGGLYGQGIDILFDFQGASYGQGNNRTFVFEFSHNSTNSDGKVILKLLGCGGRGGCRIGGRVGPEIIWDFSNDFWDLSELYSPFSERKNYCGPSFKTKNVIDLSNGSIATIGTVNLTNGATVDGVDISNKKFSNTGPYSLINWLEGDGKITNPTLTADNNKGSYIY